MLVKTGRYYLSSHIITIPLCVYSYPTSNTIGNILFILYIYHRSLVLNNDPDLAYIKYLCKTDGSYDVPKVLTTIEKIPLPWRAIGA